jgi:UDP-N-acetylmuramoyl-tripeptide--D-alanyl-D-alanine ligase
MYSSAEIAGWTSNDWKNCEAEFPIIGISHDTRTLQPGEVYIAIRGENHDGHDFVEQAVAKGAVAVIVEHEFPGLGKPQLVVPDAVAALWQIAGGARAGWTGTVIGVTGSAGKTTVKEMIAAVLSRKGRVSKTRGNWNNEIGLPLSMISADRRSDFFVFELGMSHPGEIGLLAGLLKPDWALITNIGKAHIGSFQTLEDIADEKAAILAHAKHGLLNADSEWFGRMKERFDGRLVTLTDELFHVSQPGVYMQKNARFAATIGLEMGLSKEEVQAGLDEFEPAPMRWAVSPFKGITFINDAYNANPLSMRAAISTFAEMPCEGRRFLVLGGMLELGRAEEEEHMRLGEFVEAFSFDKVITVGPVGAKIVCSGLIGIEKARVAQVLRDELRAGDMVLFKASRGERLETILEDLKTEF